MRKLQGFTLIELMLSMTFVAILLLMVAALTIQITNIYTKGTTLKAVNQAGADITSELTSVLNQSSPDRVNTSAVDAMKVDGKTVGGRLCTGEYSYAWNYGSEIEHPAVGGNKYVSGAHPYDIHFAKVADPAGSLCVADVQTHTYPEIPVSGSTELLAAGERNVAVQSLTVTLNDVGGGQTIYAVNLVLGTNTGNEVYITGGGKCRPPSDSHNQGFDEFCAVNTFDFTTRAANKEAGS